MSGRTAQCQECTSVFDVAARGIVPKLCPSCKNGASERSSSASKPRKTVKASSNGHGSIEDALTALRTDLEATQGRAAQLEKAIDALEKIVA